MLKCKFSYKTFSQKNKIAGNCYIKIEWWNQPAQYEGFDWTHVHLQFDMWKPVQGFNPNGPALCV
jgi:hypothetical protein